MRNFIPIRNGRQRWHAANNVARHSHNQAYAAVVLSGSYEECGSRGRLHVGPGNVLIHGAFDAHLDRFLRNGAQIFNLLIPHPAPNISLGRVFDPDAIVRAAELDPVEAAGQLRAQLFETNSVLRDWPDILAADILDDSDCCLSRWARNHGLGEETISRGFGKVFDITPASFRAEVRARRAFGFITGSNAPLVEIAAATGFADQAHMSRATRALTGSPPSFWRKSSPFNTG